MATKSQIERAVKLLREGGLLVLPSNKEIAAVLDYVLDAGGTVPLAMDALLMNPRPTWTRMIMDGAS